MLIVQSLNFKLRNKGSNFTFKKVNCKEPMIALYNTAIHYTVEGRKSIREYLYIHNLSENRLSEKAYTVYTRYNYLKKLRSGEPVYLYDSSK